MMRCGWCDWTLRVLPSGIVFCALCDHGHSISNANAPYVRPAAPNYEGETVVQRAERLAREANGEGGTTTESSGN